MHLLVYRRFSSLKLPYQHLSLYYRTMAPYTYRKMLRYAITSRALFPGDARQQLAALVEQALRWASTGIDLIQLREKNLPASTLADLARSILRNLPTTTKLLINSRLDVAIATGAHGVHLTSSPGELTPKQIRHLYASANLPPPVLSVSCHTLAEVIHARDSRVDAILFGPVFEKSVAGEIISTGQGFDQLHTVCTAAAPTPVYALGGVTFENAPACVEAGAAGIAGIRLFHLANSAHDQS
jgi:thiamine-phosphate pyrophosphorylase